MLSIIVPLYLLLSALLYFFAEYLLDIVFLTAAMFDL